MTRKFILPLAGVACAGISFSQNISPQKPLNIIFVISDDHTQQMISCYDSTHMRTPNLDRLANEGGVKFANSFVANSLCGPARACILTGKHSHTNGFKTNEGGTRFDSSQSTFPRILKNNGYQTAIFGKWHLESNPVGFDQWMIFPGQGDYYNPTFITENGNRKIDGYVTNIVMDLGIDWLKKRDTTKPFFLMIGNKATHRNWMSEEKYLSLYEDTIFKLPNNFFDDYNGRIASQTAEMKMSDLDPAYDLKMDIPDKTTRLSNAYRKDVYGKMNDFQKKQWDSVYNPLIKKYQLEDPKGKEYQLFAYQRYMRDYAKVAKSVDDNMGRLLEYLEKSDLLDNTLIVYTSDQGFYMGEHNFFDKRFIYEESLRTPLIMRMPNKSKHKTGVIDNLVQNIDYAPTFLELANIKVPKDIQGVSFAPLLQGKSASKWRKGVYYHFYEYPGEHTVKRHYGIRTNRYTLVHFYNDIDVWELYDLEKDPHQMNNLYNDAEYASIIKELKKELKKLQIQYNDPILKKYPL